MIKTDGVGTSLIFTKSKEKNRKRIKSTKSKKKSKKKLKKNKDSGDNKEDEEESEEEEEEEKYKMDYIEHNVELLSSKQCILIDPNKGDLIYYMEQLSVTL